MMAFHAPGKLSLVKRAWRWFRSELSKSWHLIFLTSFNQSHPTELSQIPIPQLTTILKCERNVIMLIKRCACIFDNIVTPFHTQMADNRFTIAEAHQKILAAPINGRDLTADNFLLKSRQPIDQDFLPVSVDGGNDFIFD